MLGAKSLGFCEGTEMSLTRDLLLTVAIARVLAKHSIAQALSPSRLVSSQVPNYFALGFRPRIGRWIGRQVGPTDPVLWLNEVLSLLWAKQRVP